MQVQVLHVSAWTPAAFDPDNLKRDAGKACRINHFRSKPDLGTLASDSGTALAEIPSVAVRSQERRKRQ